MKSLNCRFAAIRTAAEWQPSTCGVDIAKLSKIISAEVFALPSCESCKFCYFDNRIMKYRRQPMYFCTAKGAFFSRNFKVGEGTRIDKGGTICDKYQEYPHKDKPPVYVEK
ncbi:MAG: hypothetical protein RRZ73_02935 [Oscillospiraceae bacterium]